LSGAICNGALVMLRRANNPAMNFSRQEQQLIESLCAPVSVAIANAQLYKDLRQSNAALLRANRLKSEFLATISHELRTPLSNITGYTEMLQEGFYGPLPGEIHDPLQRIQRNARQLLAQVEDVLDLSMLEAGYVQITLAPTNLEQLIQDLLRSFKPLVDERNLQLHAAITTDLNQVMVDTGRLRQLLHHLLENAIKYTNEGRIEISAHRVPDPAGLIIEVRDTGIGIPNDMQQSIFEEFRRIDVSSTRQQGGIGVGLAIVYRLVRLMDGTISLQSEINTGSCFRIELPLPAA
jgi:signal transduction histidine kinase